MCPPPPKKKKNTPQNKNKKKQKKQKNPKQTKKLLPPPENQMLHTKMQISSKILPFPCGTTTFPHIFVWCAMNISWVLHILTIFGKMLCTQNRWLRNSNGHTRLVTLLVLGSEYCGRTNSVGECYGYWWPGSLRRQVISSHGIDYVELGRKVKVLFHRCIEKWQNIKMH